MYSQATNKSCFEQLQARTMCTYLKQPTNYLFSSNFKQQSHALSSRNYICIMSTSVKQQKCSHDSSMCYCEHGPWLYLLLFLGLFFIKFFFLTLKGHLDLLCLKILSCIGWGIFHWHNIHLRYKSMTNFQSSLIKKSFKKTQAVSS